MRPMEQLAFLPGIAEKLGRYVYALRDPRPGGTIFYVGKGTGDRVYDHAIAALAESDAEEDLKLKTIRDIRNEKREVGVEIIRHHLDNRTAEEVEAGVIDALRLIGIPLANKALGKRSVGIGWPNCERYMRRRTWLRRPIV